MEILEYLFNNVDALSVIISYFVPGAFSVYIYRFICKNTYKGKEDGNLIFKSVIISGVAYILSDWFFNLLNIGSIYKVIIITVICSLIAYILGRLRFSGKFDKILSFLKIKQTTNTFWSDAFEHGNKSKIEFFKDGKNFHGSLEYWEELDDNQCYFSIVNLKVINTDGGEYIFPKNVRMVVCSTEVTDIVVINDLVESKLKKLSKPKDESETKKQTSTKPRIV